MTTIVMPRHINFSFIDIHEKKKENIDFEKLRDNLNANPQPKPMRAGYHMRDREKVKEISTAGFSTVLHAKKKGISRQTFAGSPWRNLSASCDSVA